MRQQLSCMVNELLVNMNQNKSPQLPSLSDNRSRTQSSHTRIRKVQPLVPRYQHLEMLKTTINELQSSKSGKQELLSAIKRKVKDQFDQLYVNYDQNKDQIISEIKGLESKKGCQVEVQFIEKQTQVQKRKHDNLVDLVRKRQSELDKLLVKEKELKQLQLQTSALVQQLESGKRVEQDLRHEFVRVDYEKSVLENMLEVRRSQVQFSRDFFQERYRTLKDWSLKSDSCQVNLSLTQNKIRLLTLQAERDRDKALLSFQIDKLQEEFKVILQHELQEFVGKRAIRQIIIHQKELEMRKQAEEREQKRRREEQLRTRREQDVVKELQAKRSMQERLLKQEQSYSTIRKETALKEIQNFIPNQNSLELNFQTLLQVRQRLIQQRDSLKQQIQQVGCTLDARNVSKHDMIRIKDIEQLSRNQFHLKEKLHKTRNTIDKSLLLASKLFALSGKSVQIRRENAGSLLSLSGDGVQSLRLMKQ